MKKLLALLLAMLLVMTVFAGCADTTEESSDAPESSAADKESEKEEEKPTDDEAEDDSILNPAGTYPLVKEPVTMTMTLLVGPKDNAPEDMWFFQYYEELTGIHWDVTAILKDDWGEKKPIMLATAEYTDVFWGTSWTTGEIYKNGMEGTFIDLAPYYDYTPNYVREMDAIDGSWSYVTTPDGKNYSLASVAPVNWYSTSTGQINQKWLENVDMEVPTTIDEFYEVLKAFKEQDANGNGDPNDEIPLSGYYTDSTEMRGILLRMFGLLTDGSYTVNGNIALDPNSDRDAVFVPFHERYKEYLVFMNKLMSEGLVDADLFTQDQSQYFAKGAEYRVGTIMTNYSHYVDIDHLDHYVLLPVGYNADEERVVTQGSPIGFGKFVVTDICETPEIALSWIDIFYLPEHAFDILYGPIITKDANGNVTYVSAGITEDPLVASLISLDADGVYIGFDNSTWEPESDEWTLWDWYCRNHPGNGAFQSTISEGYYLNLLFPTRPTTAEDQYQTQLARYERADPTDNSNRGEGWWRWQNIKHNYDLIQFGYPTVYLNDEQQTFMDENSTIINDYVMQMEAKFITGAASIDGEFDGFIEELKKLGAEEYEKIYQDVYVK
ncbi:MAG: extracellular solute-binding protein [Ruminococcaceae bacterium]|nr:extracellular solute-binding protein [Oscillospiraceae bacterium]